MPTFKIIVGPVKTDNTHAISIQVTHNRLKKYIPTGHLVKKSSLTNKGVLKDRDLIKVLEAQIDAYTDKLLKLGGNLNNYDIDFIKDYIKKEEEVKDIDFVEYCRTFIAKQGEGTGRNTQTVLNALIDFVGKDKLFISRINLKLIKSFEDYLRSEREVKRQHPNGEQMKLKLKPLSDTGIRDYMGKLKQVFTSAQDEYNDENKVLIPYNPFTKYKMPKPASTKKRNVKHNVIQLIRDVPDIETGKYKRKEVSALARDVFMLSFYLVGMNLVDIYNANEYKDGRISYKRTKTASRKNDKAIISIKIEPEVLPLLEKYKDPTGKRVFNFHLNYTNHDGLTGAVNRGLATISEHLNIPPITAYWARHSWSTIARNVCRISKDDIHFALNHSDPDMRTTDIYIEEDYSIIDEANRKVLDALLKIED